MIGFNSNSEQPKQGSYCEQGRVYGYDLQIILNVAGMGGAKLRPFNVSYSLDKRFRFAMTTGFVYFPQCVFVDARVFVLANALKMPSIDTKDKFTGNGSLDGLCKHYGLEGKQEMSHAEAGTFLRCERNADEMRVGMTNFVDYAIQDVVCLKQLITVSRTVNILEELAKLRMVSLHDVFSYETNGILVDYMCAHVLSKGWILPYKFRNIKMIDEQGQEIHAKTQGAFNYYKPGLFSDITEVDISSAYPSFMIMFGLSPEAFHSITDEKLEQDGIRSVRLIDAFLP